MNPNWKATAEDLKDLADVLDHKFTEHEMTTLLLAQGTKIDGGI